MLCSAYTVDLFRQDSVCRISIYKVNCVGIHQNKCTSDLKSKLSLFFFFLQMWHYITVVIRIRKVMDFVHRIMIYYVVAVSVTWFNADRLTFWINAGIICVEVSSMWRYLKHCELQNLSFIFSFKVFKLLFSKMTENPE